MRVRWQRAEGATGYMLLYSAINATQPTLEQEVRGFPENTENIVLPDQRAHSQSAVDMTALNTRTCVYGRTSLAYIHIHQNTNALLNTGSDQTLQHTVSSSDKTQMSGWYDISQSHQCLPRHSADKARGKTQRGIVRHRGVGEAMSSFCQGNIIICSWGVRSSGSTPESADVLQPNTSPAVCIQIHPFPPLTMCCLFGLGRPQIRVGGDTTDVQLVKLLPNTAYSLSLFALHGESASAPLTKQGVTRK